METGTEQEETEELPPPRVFGARDMAILEFERLRWKYPEAKVAAVLNRFSMSSTAYHSQLRWITQQPEALAYDPVTVRRLQRLAGQFRALRTHGSSSVSGPVVPDSRGVRPRMA